jgi:hypothetical protein
MAPKSKAKAKASSKDAAKKHAKRFAYWVTTTSDLNWKPEDSDEVSFTVRQQECSKEAMWPNCKNGELPKQEPEPECGLVEGFEPSSDGMHMQAYSEFFQKRQGKAVSEALHQDVKDKGDQSGSGKQYWNQPRISTQEIAIAYCSSDWFCHSCHVGDHEEVAHLFPWSYTADKHNVTSTIDGVVKSHDNCPMLHFKGKVGPAIWYGNPSAHGGGHGGRRSGDVVEQQQQFEDDVKNGMRRSELITKYKSLFYRYHGAMDKVLMALSPDTRVPPAIYWLYGSTGTEKSRLARAVSTDCYNKMPNNRWFDEYDNHEVLIIHDLREGLFDCAYLLQLFDRYSFKVEVKGGTRPMRAKLIIITCPRSHTSIWDDMRKGKDEDVMQLTRRITEEVEFPQPEDFKVELLARMRHKLWEKAGEEKELVALKGDDDAKYGAYKSSQGPPSELLTPMKPTSCAAAEASSSEKEERTKASRARPSTPANTPSPPKEPLAKQATRELPPPNVRESQLSWGPSTQEVDRELPEVPPMPDYYWQEEEPLCEEFA